MPAQFASLILPVGVFVVFYFLLIRPQQKKDKKIKEMRSNLKPKTSLALNKCRK